MMKTTIIQLPEIVVTLQTNNAMNVISKEIWRGSVRLPSLPRVLLKNLSPLDALYLRQKVISCNYFYKHRIDRQTLKKSVLKLLKVYPFLCGRVINNNPFLSRNMFSNFAIASSEKVAVPIVYKQVQSKHTFEEILCDFDDVHNNFVELTSAYKISQGKDAPMTLSVTQFNGEGHEDDRGCILGVSISHGLVDGFSFHKIVKLLAKIYNNNGDEDASLIEYNGDRYYQELTQEYRKCSLHINDMASDSVQTVNYSAYYKCFMLKLFLYLESTAEASFAKNNKQCRTRVSFTNSDLKMIERSKHGDNFSSVGDNIVSSLLASMYQDKPLPKTLAMTINMRSPRIYCLDDNYIGNAVHTIYEQGHSSASTFANIMERIVRLKRQLYPNSIDVIREEFYQNLNLLENNITSAPHSLHRDVIFINNQLSFPMLPSFGLHNKCMRAIPGKGDDIHIIPSAKKGIDVYVSQSTMPRKMTSSALKRNILAKYEKDFP